MAFDSDAFIKAAGMGALALLVITFVGVIPCLGWLVFCVFGPVVAVMIGAGYGYFAKEKSGEQVDLVSGIFYGGTTAAVAVVPAAILSALFSIGGSLFNDNSVLGAAICAPISILISMVITGGFGSVGGAIYSAMSN